MRVVGRKRLAEFAARHGEVRSQFDAWYWEVEESNWKQPNDIKVRYPSASFLSENRVVFNVKGNKYRLLVKVSYQLQEVLVLKVGTHAEYAKWKV